MARAIYLWLPSLTAFALSACSGSETGFFSNVVTAGASSASHAGASSSAGSSSNSGSPGSAGSTINPGSAGQHQAGDGSGGAQTGGTSAGGASSGGASSGGAHSGGTAGISAGAGARAGAGGGGASAGHAGANSGSAGVGGSTQELNCSELVKLANQQLEAARECNPDLDSLQCTGTVTTTCGCEVPVQKQTSAETKAYLNTLKRLQDKDCVQVCTAIACSSVDNAQCRASNGSNTGTCVASRGPTP